MLFFFSMEKCVNIFNQLLPNRLNFNFIIAQNDKWLMCLLGPWTLFFLVSALFSWLMKMQSMQFLLVNEIDGLDAILNWFKLVSMGGRRQATMETDLI